MEANFDQNQQLEHRPTDQQDDAQPKKSKVGLIIGIILGIIAVALIAVTCVWCFVYHDPGTVVADATNKLFNAENVSLSGVIRVESTDRSSDLQALMVTFDSASTNIPNFTTVQVRAMLADQDATVAIDLGTIQTKDGAIYLQISGITNTLGQFGVEQSDIEWLYDTLEVVDNEWWRFDIAEATAALEIDADDRAQIEDAYSCVVAELSNNIRGELGELYKSNDFIIVKKVDEARFANGSTYGKSFEGTDYYKLSFDYGKMAGFINGLASVNTMRRIYSCVQGNIPGSDFNASYFDEVTARELQELLENGDEVDVFFEISRWGHELKQVVVNVSQADSNITANVAFVYNNGAKIETPAHYRPLTELIDEITEAVAGILYGGYYGYIGDYDDYEYDNCSPFGATYTNCYMPGSTD